MLEILILIGLSKSIAAKANAKGRSGTPFVLMLVGLWIGGEICGAILGVIISVSSNPKATEPNMVLIYGGALAGAIIGAVISFVIVNSLADLSRRDDYDDDYDDHDDDDYRPRRRR